MHKEISCTNKGEPMDTINARFRLSRISDTFYFSDAEYKMAM